MTAEYKGYLLSTKCTQRSDGRYSVCVEISGGTGPSERKRLFRDERITLILKQEAELESLAMGRRLIDLGHCRPSLDRKTMKEE